uniref:Uncharacterized protein n=1 Tax=Setaria viridis TaxID=4556 RepID=A0A4U6U4T3_SETVI|nr:hypothetical protein SEVIR_6G178900v2 [Setaria viridis]
MVPTNLKQQLSMEKDCSGLNVSEPQKINYWLMKHPHRPQYHPYTKYKRSISKFYNGKSKSFACLKEAITSSGSAKDITKADNAYSRKRKNLLAYSIMYGNSHETAAAQVYETAPPKRLASLSRNSLATLASISSRSSSSISIEENELPEQLHSPLSPDDFISTPRSGSFAPNASSAPMRSLSMMDLHCLHRSSSSVRLKEKKED